MYCSNFFFSYWLKVLLYISSFFKSSCSSTIVSNSLTNTYSSKLYPQEEFGIYAITFYKIWFWNFNSSSFESFLLSISSTLRSISLISILSSFLYWISVALLYVFWVPSDVTVELAALDVGAAFIYICLIWVRRAFVWSSTDLRLPL